MQRAHWREQQAKEEVQQAKAEDGRSSLGLMLAPRRTCGVIMLFDLKVGQKTCLNRIVIDVGVGVGAIRA